MEVRPRLGEMDLIEVRVMPKSKPLSEVAEAGGVSMLAGGTTGAQARLARDWNDSMVEVEDIAARVWYVSEAPTRPRSDMWRSLGSSVGTLERLGPFSGHQTSQRHACVVFGGGHLVVFVGRRRNAGGRGGARRVKSG